MTMKPLPSATSRKIRAFTLLEVLLVVAIIGLMIGLLVPAITKVRDRANQISCQARLANVGLAVIQYGDANGSLPVGFRSKVENGVETGPGWGWASEILPWLEQDPLSRSIDFSVSPLHRKNADLRGARLSIFQCPSDPVGLGWELDLPPSLTLPEISSGIPGEDDAGRLFFPDSRNEMASASYVGLCGTTPVDQPGNGLLFRNSKVKKREMEDGESNTLLLSERASWVGATLWHGMLPGVVAKPTKYPAPGENYRYPPEGEDQSVPVEEPVKMPASTTPELGHPAAFTLSSVTQGLEARPQNLDGLGTWHIANTHMIFADGHLQAFNEKTSLSVLRALVTRAGGEAVNVD